MLQPLTIVTAAGITSIFCNSPDVASTCDVGCQPPPNKQKVQHQAGPLLGLHRTCQLALCDAQWFPQIKPHPHVGQQPYPGRYASCKSSSKALQQQGLRAQSRAYRASVALQTCQRST